MNDYRIAESRTLLERWLRQPGSGDFPLYTGYLQSLADGERLPAVEKYLRPLISGLAPQPHAQRMRFVDAVCRNADFRDRKAGSSVPGIPYELLHQVVLPTVLEQWRLHPEDAYAHVWLAMLPQRAPQPGLPNPRELLMEARRLAPSDPFVIERLADLQLHWIDFACHHLPEALLAPAADLLRDLEELRGLASQLGAEARERFERHAGDYARAIESYLGTQGQASQGTGQP